jgi:hypothetical protein
VRPEGAAPRCRYKSCDHPETYDTVSMTAAATRRTAPSLGLDACATSRHQTTKAAASSGMSATR